eukprot:scaffold3084_cov144-Cylindrotheca_fusiformis.AAC.30
MIFGTMTPAGLPRLCVRCYPRVCFPGGHPDCCPRVSVAGVKKVLDVTVAIWGACPWAAVFVRAIRTLADRNHSCSRLLCR